MPRYTFECQSCGQCASWQWTFEEYDLHKIQMAGEPFYHFTMGGDDRFSHARLIDAFEYCGPMAQVISVNIIKSMPDHFNSYVNQPISSTRQYKDALKVASEEATLKTGIEHNYSLADPDPEFFGVTQEGIESVKKQHTDEGRNDTQLYL